MHTFHGCLGKRVCRKGWGWKTVSPLSCPTPRSLWYGVIYAAPKGRRDRLVQEEQKGKTESLSPLSLSLWGAIITPPPKLGLLNTGLVFLEVDKKEVDFLKVFSKSSNSAKWWWYERPFAASTLLLESSAGQVNQRLPAGEGPSCMAAHLLPLFVQGAVGGAVGRSAESWELKLPSWVSLASVTPLNFFKLLFLSLSYCF